MKNKILYFDTETSGVKSHENALLQIGMIVEIDGVEKETKQINIQPHKDDVIEEGALKVNGLKREDFPSFTPPAKALREIQTFLKKYVNPYQKSDKFIPAGYHISFDIKFLRSFFFKNGDKFFGSFFHKETIDPMEEMRKLYNTGEIDTPNYKLTSVCEYFNIDLDKAHDALSDIIATKALIKLRKTQAE